MAATRVCRVLLVGLSCASALRKSKHTSASHANGAEAVAKVDTETAVSECSAPGFVVTAVRALANTLIRQLVAPADPANFSLVNIEKELEIPFCNLAFTMDVDMLASGFGDALVDSVVCSASTCVEEGFWGCRKEILTFDVKILIGALVTLHGQALGNFSNCLASINAKNSTVGVDLREPGVKASLSVEYTHGFPPQAKVLEAHEVAFETGEMERFECGFHSLPGFIAGPLERLCSTINTWILGHAADFLMPIVNEALTKLANQILDLSP